MRIYLAGPMTGLPDFNAAAFDEAAARGRALGHEISSPVEHNREFGPPSSWVKEQGFDLIEAQRWDLCAIMAAHAVAVLPNWEKSKGTCVEVDVAKWFGLPILDARTFDFLAPENLLEEALRITSTDRQQSYGHPIEHFSRTVRLINILLAKKLKEPLGPEDWPIIMMADKFSRFSNKSHRDSLVDIAGYARTAEMVKERLNDRSR